MPAEKRVEEVLRVVHRFQEIRKQAEEIRVEQTPVALRDVHYRPEGFVFSGAMNVMPVSA